MRNGLASTCIGVWMRVRTEGKRKERERKGKQRCDSISQASVNTYKYTYSPFLFVVFNVNL